MRQSKPLVVSKDVAAELELFKQVGSLKDFGEKYMQDERFTGLRTFGVDLLAKLIYEPGAYTIAEEPTTELEAGDVAVYQRDGEISEAFFVVKDFTFTPDQDNPNDFKLTTINSSEGGSYPAQYVRHPTPDEVMKYLFPKQYEKVKKIQKKEQSNLFDF